MASAKAKLGDVETHALDITDFAQVEAATKATEAALGGITQVVNSAGIAGPNTLIEDYPLDAWRTIVDVNLTGSFHILRAILPGMKARSYGRIVLIASVAGKEIRPA